MSNHMEGDKFVRLHGLKRQQATQQEWLDTCKKLIRELREAVVRGEAGMREINAMISEAEREK